MNISTADRKSALHNQANQELESLVSRGLRAVGNGFSPVLLVKGDLNAAEIAGGELLAGADGNALRSALSAVGFAPEDFCGMAAVYGEGADASAGVLGGPLSVEFFREAVEAFDPEAVILLDDAATALMREAYADALAAIEDFNTAMLMPGLVAPCWVAACWRSTDSRRRLRIARPSSACGRISSRFVPPPLRTRDSLPAASRQVCAMFWARPSAPRVGGSPCV